MVWAENLQHLVEKYRERLSQHHNSLALKTFDDRYNNDEEAAISEAVVFEWLLKMKCNPELNDDGAMGGPDFICSPSPRYEFAAEVTILKRDALTKATGCHMIPGQSMYISTPSGMMWRKTGRKATQLSGPQMPSVLIVTSLQAGADLLMGPREAEEFLLSGVGYSIPANDPDGEIHRSADLRQSVFFKLDKEDPSKIVPCRQSISAILLMPIFGDRLCVTGILHPEPTYVIDIWPFPKVPFLRVRNWPIQHGEIFTDWIIHDPYAKPYQFIPGLGIYAD